MPWKSKKERRQHHKKYHAQCVSSGKWHDQRLRSKYGITTDDFNQMLKEQKHQCFICDSPLGKGTGKYAIDHNHTTGALRKILCQPCNAGLGMFKDSIELLCKAIMYLEDHT
jgi:hypothetical protein